MKPLKSGEKIHNYYYCLFLITLRFASLWTLSNVFLRFRPFFLIFLITSFVLHMEGGSMPLEVYILSYPCSHKAFFAASKQFDGSFQ